MVEAFILAGGYGTRLGLKDTPKPLVKVAGKHLIDYALERILEIEDVRRVVVSVNARFEEKFREWADGKDVPVPLEVIVEPHKEDGEKLGSIGAIHNFVVNHRRGGDLLVAAGDNACDFSIVPVYRKAKEARKPVLGLYKVSDVSVIVKRFGNAVVSEDGKIEKIVEKPEKPVSPYILTGFFVIPEEYVNAVVEYMESGNNPDAFGYFFQWLAPKGVLHGHVLEGLWFDVGTPESWKEAEEAFRNKYT